MNNYILIIFLLFISSSLTALESTYRLGVGDEIEILVYDEADLTVQITINDDGNINFPLIGRISVSGNTATQVQKLIHDGLKNGYLLNPSVQVDIITYRPFYIHGEVNKPGAYSYQPGLNVDQAIALAGGLTERASASKIFIKQLQKSSKKSSKVELSYSVSPGDIITIEQSFF